MTYIYKIHWPIPKLFFYLGVALSVCVTLILLGKSVRLDSSAASA